MITRRAERIGSLNVKYNMSNANAGNDILGFITERNLSTLGLQEFGQRGNDFFETVLREEGFGYYRPRGILQGNNAFTWELETWHFAGGKPVRLDKDPWFRARGAKVETWGCQVDLVHRATKVHVPHMVVHLPSSVQVGEKPDLKHDRDRVRNMQQSLTTLNKWQLSYPKSVAPVIVGDMNWDSDHDKWKGTPENRLKGMVSQYEMFAKLGPSHGRREIDYIFIQQRNKHMEFLNAGRYADLKTDHHGVWATVELKGW